MTGIYEKPANESRLVRQAERLDKLFSAIRQLQCPQGDSKLSHAQRLTGVLEAIRLYRRDEALRRTETAAPSRQIDGDSLSAFLEKLRIAVQESKKDGRLFNVWEIVGLQRYEVMTTKVLAWALDPYETHGLGSAVLNALLARLKDRSYEHSIFQMDISNGYRVRREYCPFERDNRIDISIEGKSCIMFIEVKIDAPEGKDQLMRYAALAKKVAIARGKSISCVMYLSESPPKDAPDGTVLLRWRDVAQAIQEAVGRSGVETIATKIMLQFSQHIKAL